jgi:hypothetical protein
MACSWTARDRSLVSRLALMSQMGASLPSRPADNYLYDTGSMSADGLTFASLALVGADIFIFESSSWRLFTQVTCVGPTVQSTTSVRTALNPNGSLLAIGFSTPTSNGADDGGSVFVYQRTSTGFDFLVHLHSPIPTPSASFGSAAAFSASWLFVGKNECVLCDMWPSNLLTGERGADKQNPSPSPRPSLLPLSV